MDFIFSPKGSRTQLLHFSMMSLADNAVPNRLSRYLMLALCLLVLTLSVRAKLLLYAGQATTDPTVASKLWVNSDAPDVQAVSNYVPIFCLLSLFFLHVLHPTTLRVAPYRPVTPHYSSAFDPHLFLRPPPSV
jgi:hypothetical protein